MRPGSTKVLGLGPVRVSRIGFAKPFLCFALPFVPGNSGWCGNPGWCWNRCGTRCGNPGNQYFLEINFSTSLKAGQYIYIYIELHETSSNNLFAASNPPFIEFRDSFTRTHQQLSQRRLSGFSKDEPPSHPPGLPS